MHWSHFNVPRLYQVTGDAGLLAKVFSYPAELTSKLAFCMLSVPYGTVTFWEMGRGEERKTFSDLRSQRPFFVPKIRQPTLSLTSTLKKTKEIGSFELPCPEIHLQRF